MARWKIDPDHAAAGFTIRHMMVTPVHGQFSGVTGEVVFDPADPAAASVEVEVDVSSLSTGVDRRDTHLKSPDLFDAGKFPRMYFKSSRVEVVGMNRCKVLGDLTIRDVTRPVVFDVYFAGPSRFFDDEEDRLYTAYGFQATAGINREDFGMFWNLAIEDGGFMVGRHVDIVFNAEVDLVEELPKSASS